MTKTENLLPIGSVVKLKESEKKMMVAGILINNGEKKYDYLGVMHPEGFVDSRQIFLFNHEDIEEVFFFGYMNAEFQMFRGALAQKMEETGESAL